MKKIIKHGLLYVEGGETTCEKCLCEFSFESEDLQTSFNEVTKHFIRYAYCPECGSRCIQRKGV